ncbi:MAG: hypothetical protein H0U96_08625 [Acidobacteria bacterium]|nr:hypothetical protein [Acidobacteriota bacterium]
MIGTISKRSPKNCGKETTKPRKERQSAAFIMRFIGEREIFSKAKVSFSGNTKRRTFKSGTNTNKKRVKPIKPLENREANYIAFEFKPITLPK